MLLARHTTTVLVLEALQRFGPLTEREICTLLSESWQATSGALNRLLTLGVVRCTATASHDAVLYVARKDV